MTSKVNLNDYAYFLERLQYHIDLDTDEYIEHFGVKGMRWGVRKDRSESAPLKSLGPDKVVTTTKNGTTLTLQKDAPTTLHKTFAKLSKNYRESYSKSANFDITVNDGQKIGTGMVDLKSKDELYLNWIQIDTSARGNGYATAALKAAIDFGKDSGVKKLTLEVPGNAPDARHIYEKLGFKVTKEADETDGVWGGLTEMEYSLNSAAQSSFSRYVIHGIKDVSLDSLRKSKWEVFDPEFAKMIKEEHPDIWDEGGNIKGNDQYEILSKIFEQGGTAKTDSQIAAIELREAWVARHKDDFRLPGVVAQIKWLAVGSRGQEYMKNLVKETIKKREEMTHEQNDDIDISMEDFLTHYSDFLAHYGVKGMRWGVINKDDSAQKNSANKHDSLVSGISTGDYKKVLDKNPKLTNREIAKNLSDNKAKAAAKFDPKGESAAEPKGWRPTKKQVAIAAVGAGVAALLIYEASQGKFKKPIPGEPISASAFKSAVTNSQIKTWGGQGYLTEASLAREGFSLPPGHEFYRISTVAETGAHTFAGGTYVTHSVEDFNRYVAGFRGELGKGELYKITMRSNSEVRVPSTKEALDTMNEVLSDWFGKPATPEQVISTYGSMSGGKWNGDIADNFFKALSKKGFGAIVDEMDAGVIGETPLVLFNRDAISSYRPAPLTRDQIEFSERSLKELINRKP